MKTFVNNAKMKSIFKKVLGLGQWLIPINQTTWQKAQDCLRKRVKGEQTLCVHTCTHTHAKLSLVIKTTISDFKNMH